MTTASPLWFLAAAMAFVVLGVWVLSRLAGWALLAQHYPQTAPVSGVSFHFASVSLGSVRWPIRYRHCATVVLHERGMTIGLMFPFRFMSPSFDLPWSAVSKVHQRQALFNRTVVFHLHHHPFCISLPDALGQQALAAYQQACPEAAA